MHFLLDTLLNDYKIYCVKTIWKNVYDLCCTYKLMSKIEQFIYYNKIVFLNFVLTYGMITTLILTLQNDLCCTYEFMSKLYSI